MSQRDPAEPSQRDDESSGSPGDDDQQVAQSEPRPRRVRVVGDEKRSREMTDWEHVRDVQQPVRKLGRCDEYPGDEVEGQHDRLGNWLRGVLVLDERRYCEAHTAK